MPLPSAARSDCETRVYTWSGLMPLMLQYRRPILFAFLFLFTVSPLLSYARCVWVLLSLSYYCFTLAYRDNSLIFLIRISY